VSVRLFVGNLDYTVTEAALRDHFAQCGPVTSVRIPLDRETGRSRGFAFVELAERAHAEDAIARLNDMSFEGRRLAVSEAVDRSQAPAPRERSPMSGGGGGVGGGGGGGGGAPQPARRFGPDAAPASKRRGPPPKARGPIKERRGGGSSAGDGDDSSPDDVPFWALRDAENDNDAD